MCNRGLVGFQRHPEPDPAAREATFAAVDAAFAQRRKMLRSALRDWAAPLDAASVCDVRQVGSHRRGESLAIGEFLALADAKSRLTSPSLEGCRFQCCCVGGPAKINL